MWNIFSLFFSRICHIYPLIDALDSIMRHIREMARRWRLYLHSTQQTQDTNIHTPGAVWTSDPISQADADLRLTVQGHRHRHTLPRGGAGGDAGGSDISCNLYGQAVHGADTKKLSERPPTCRRDAGDPLDWRSAGAHSSFMWSDVL